jgi:hypothetical protein
MKIYTLQSHGYTVYETFFVGPSEFEITELDGTIEINLMTFTDLDHC